MDNVYYSVYRGIKRAAGEAAVGGFAELDLHEAEVRLQALDELWAKFNRTHDLMLSDPAADMEELDGCMERAERRYYRASAALRRYIAEAQGEQDKKEKTPVQVNVTVPVQQCALKNTWGEFDGDLLKWLSFRDRFVAAVHKNEQVSPAFKFGYLKKSLVGEAARALGEWQLTDDNYNEAWERLVQRYDKKYPICREHLRSFLRLPKLSGPPTAEGLQNMVNVSHESIRQLKALGIPVEHWDMLIVHVIHERLYEDTARQWELCRASEMPTWKEMLEFLERQAASLPAARAAGSSIRAGHESRAANRQTPDRAIKCLVCDGDHYTYRCDDLLSLTLNARRDFVMK